MCPGGTFINCSYLHDIRLAKSVWFRVSEWRMTRESDCSNYDETETHLLWCVAFASWDLEERHIQSQNSHWDQWLVPPWNLGGRYFKSPEQQLPICLRAEGTFIFLVRTQNAEQRNAIVHSYSSSIASIWIMMVDSKWDTFLTSAYIFGDVVCARKHHIIKIPKWRNMLVISLPHIHKIFNNHNHHNK